MDEETPPEKKGYKTFWDTLTGTIVKITGLVGAIAGLIVAISTLGKSCNKDAGGITSKSDTPHSTISTPDTPHKHIFTPPEIRDFLDAAGDGKTDILKQDLDLGINVDIVLGDNKTALISALDNNKPEAVKLLLDHGADPNVRVRGNTYPIIEASYSGQIEIVDLLVQHKADINVKKSDGSGLTALMFACIRGNKEIVQKLINASNPSVIVNDKSNNNSTALDFANELQSPLKEQIINILNTKGALSGH